MFFFIISSGVISKWSQPTTGRFRCDESHILLNYGGQNIPLKLLIYIYQLDFIFPTKRYVTDIKNTIAKKSATIFTYFNRLRNNE